MSTIQIANVRASWPNLFRARAMEEGQTPKFSIVSILDKKKHAKDIEALKAAMKAVAEEKWGKGKVPSSVKYCLRDGSDKADVDGYGPDVMFFSAANDKKPMVVDANNATLDEQDGKIYAGCYVDVSVRLWAQDNKYGKRVNAQLRAVRFRKDGEAFGDAGAKDANAEFGNLPPAESEGLD